MPSNPVQGARSSKDEKREKKKEKRPRSISDSDEIVTNPKVVQIFEEYAHWSNKSTYSSIYVFYRLQTFRNIFPGKITMQNRPRFFFPGPIPEKTSDTSFVDIVDNCSSSFTRILL